MHTFSFITHTEIIVKKGVIYKMADFASTETCLNLMRAFAGESQARTRYSLYAKQAHKEGLIEIHDVFNETAHNELAHAHIFFKYLNDKLGSRSVPVNAEYPTGIKETLFNLRDAASGEHDEHSNVYPHFAEVAKQEGFLDIANNFTMIAEIEKHHEERFNHFIKQLADQTLFKKAEQVYYKCEHCGYIHFGTDAPKVCPNCLHEQGYFKVTAKPWQ